MKTLAADAEECALWVATALLQSGYQADFSLESLKEIDRFFDEHSSNGKAVPGGLLAEQLGARLFAPGSYFGEVIRRATGERWQGDDSDPEGEIHIEVALDNGTVLRPVEQVIDRFQKGRAHQLYPNPRGAAPTMPRQ